MAEIINAFLLFFGSLFPIVNPPGSAFLFLAYTSHLTPDQRAGLAKRIALYSFLIVCGSQYLGAYILSLFGVSIVALRLGGGLVLAVAGYRMLNASSHDPDHTAGIAPGADPAQAAFYPLTIPLTTGPGTIAVTIALGSGYTDASLAANFGALLAAAAIAASVYGCYRFADKMATLLGRTLTDALMRLFALLLLCIGIEIMLKGLKGAFAALTAVTVPV